MRKEVVIALLCFLLLGLSGCAGSRTTTKEKRTAESQLREATLENKQTEKREAKTAETNTESSEKRNLVIEFTKVEYYPEKKKRPNRFTEQFQKADSLFNEGLKDKSKPPNVKSKTTGRIVINGDKQETTETKEVTNKDEATTDATATTKEEGTKETTQVKEKKYPKITPFLWVLIGCGLAAVVSGYFYIRGKFLKKQ